MERMLTLSRKLDFSEVRRTVPLISASRWLVRESDVEFILGPELADSTPGSVSGGWGQRLPTHCLLLFTDILVVTRKLRFAREDNISSQIGLFPLQRAQE